MNSVTFRRGVGASEGARGGEHRTLSPLIQKSTGNKLHPVQHELEFVDEWLVVLCLRIIAPVGWRCTYGVSYVYCTFSIQGMDNTLTVPDQAIGGKNQGYMSDIVVTVALTVVAVRLCIVLHFYDFSPNNRRFASGVRSLSTTDAGASHSHYYQCSGNCRR